jgi:hypothetical protein
MGGKPYKGTPADRRLKENKNKLVKEPKQPKKGAK